MSFPLHCLLVFVLMVCVDFAWSAYVRSLADKKMLKASAWSAMIVLIGGFSSIEYISDNWLIVPAAVGAFVGTYLSLIFEKKEAS